MVVSELSRYSDWRFANYKRHWCHFASKKIAEEEKNIKLYKSILNSLGVDPNIVSEEGELTMTNQDMEILPYNCAVNSNISSTDESATVTTEESEL